MPQPVWNTLCPSLMTNDAKPSCVPGHHRLDRHGAWPRVLRGAQGLLCGLLGSLALTAQAQPLTCSNDGRKAPTALLERFMDADCTRCWQELGTVQPPPGALALDWVRPSPQSDEAAMSAVALPEALERLQVLGLPVTGATSSQLTKPKARQRLRVVQGFAVNGYLGAKLSYRPNSASPYTAWLLLVEQVPAGTEGSPVARQLVRAAAELRPGTRDGKPLALNDTRAFLLPAGANPEHLRVLGWVQDELGHLLALGQTHCSAQP